MNGNMNADNFVTGLEYKGPLDLNAGYPNHNVQKGDCYIISNNVNHNNSCFQVGDVIVAGKNNPGQNDWHQIQTSNDMYAREDDLVDRICRKYKIEISTEETVTNSLFNMK